MPVWSKLCCAAPVALRCASIPASLLRNSSRLAPLVAASQQRGILQRTITSASTTLNNNRRSQQAARSFSTKQSDDANETINTSASAASSESDADQVKEAQIVDETDSTNSAEMADQMKDMFDNDDKFKELMEKMKIDKNFDPSKFKPEDMDELDGEDAEFNAADDAAKIKKPAPTAPQTANKQRNSFQAETKKILDIVAHSLYTDKEVFLRELVSNASDALEKRRYMQTMSATQENDATKDASSDAASLEIEIETDEDNRLLMIRDTGIGMNQQELISNLGTIARSGSKQFMQEMADKAKSANKSSSDDNSNIIGQFGVGFYSAFMVGDKIEVYSRSSAKGPDADNKCYFWTSDGSGEYEVSEVTDEEHMIEVGTKIVIHLKPESADYAIKYRIEDVIKKYSNYVAFPIKLNGQLVNTVKAIWTQSPSSVSEDDYAQFYKFYTAAFDTPVYRLHFETDAPIAIHALLYFPSTHSEKLGMPRQEMGVNLYCRKVLIKQKCENILPDYLRFVKGVVDSEDIPLNISRENMQDSKLINKMRDVLTVKILKFIHLQAKKDPKKYQTYIEEFGMFFKEGVVMDFSHRQACARLLRYQTSTDAVDAVSSLDDYIGRMPPKQKKIYYLQAPNRGSALASPYYEQFKERNIEVIFCYHAIDEFVMSNLIDYSGRELQSCESANLDDLKTDDEKAKEKEESEKSNTAQADELIRYMQDVVLQGRVKSVRRTNKLRDSPAVIVDHESAALRRMKKQLSQTSGRIGLENDGMYTKNRLEINVQHPIMKQLMERVTQQPRDDLLLKICIDAIYDNAMISADIMDNPRDMVGRTQALIEQTLKLSAPQAAKEKAHKSEPVAEEKSAKSDASQPEAKAEPKQTSAQA